MKKNTSLTGIFLGAGASWDSGLPLGDDAARFMVQCLFKGLQLDPYYEELVNYEKDKGIHLWPRFEVIIKTFEDYIPDSSQLLVETFSNCGISSTCLSLTQVKNIRVWFTTNFDNQIELALEKAGIQYRVFADREKMEKTAIRNINCDYIFKLHGDSSVSRPSHSLGATIDQILRKFPELITSNITKQLELDELIFIGYAARDPDLHDFILKLISKAKRIKWIDIGQCREKIYHLIGKDFEYYGEGTPKALETIFNFPIQKSVKFDNIWTEKMEELISSFPADSLAHIAADLCLITNNNKTFGIVEKIQEQIDPVIPFNQFHIIRRQIQMMFHSPTGGKNENINKNIRELQIISNLCTDIQLRSKIDLYVSTVLWKVNSPQISIKQLNRIAANFGKETSAFVELQITLGIAKIYYGAKLFNKGLRQLNNARKLASRLQFPILEAEANLRYSIALMRGSKPEESEPILKQTKAIYDEIGNQRSLLIWQLNLAESYRTQRKFLDSLEVLNDLIKKSELAEDREIMLNAIGNKGLLLPSIGEMTSGDGELQRVIDLVTQIESNKESKANALYNRGWLRIICCRWKQAIPYLLLAEESYRYDYFSPERRGGALALIGISEYFLGNIEKSKKIAEKIERKNIVPAGNMKMDYQLLKFLITHSFEKDIIKEAQSEFREAHEQFFYLNFMLLQQNISDVELIENCIICAHQASLIPFWHLIIEHLSRHNITVDSKKISLVKENLIEDFQFLED